MKQVIFFLITTILFINCTKKDSSSQGQASTDVFDKAKVSIDGVEFVSRYIYGDYAQLIFRNDSLPTEVDRGYSQDDNGTYKIIFNSENGNQSLVRDDGGFIGSSSTGITYSVKYSDTFYLYKVADNSLYKTFVMNKLPNPNRTVYLTFSGTDQSKDETITYANDFIQNTMPTMRFKEYK